MKYLNSIDIRGVSETIGYIVIFGLVVSTISLVYVNGFPALISSEESVHISNTEKAYTVFQNNMQDISRGFAPSRGTEIRLSNSKVDLDGDSQTKINVTIKSSSGSSFSFVSNSTPVVHTIDNENVIYDSGAIIRDTDTSENSSGMKYPPDWKIEEDTVIVSVVRTTGTGTRAGEDTVLLEAKETGVSSNVSTADNITVKVTSPRANAWESYFRKSSDVASVSRDGSSTVMTVTGTKIKALYFRTDIKLTIS
ncbi:MAG: hypothetical protein ABEK59_01010 [Halobacteria archaeon]